MLHRRTTGTSVNDAAALNNISDRCHLNWTFFFNIFAHPHCHIIPEKSGTSRVKRSPFWAHTMKYSYLCPLLKVTKDQWGRGQESDWRRWKAGEGGNQEEGEEEEGREDASQPFHPGQKPHPQQVSFIKCSSSNHYSNISITIMLICNDISNEIIGIIIITGPLVVFFIGISVGSFAILVCLFTIWSNW